MGTRTGRSVIASPHGHLVLVVVVSVNVVYAQNCGCASGLCCSKYGYCGMTSDYCGDGCQSGPCTSSGGGSPTTGGGNVGTIVSQSFFDGLAGRSCCSKYGYCGTTSDYCGDGCQSGSCTSSGGGSPSTGDGNVGTIISQSFFDGLAGRAASSCEGKGFYTYDAFIAAANAYSGFGTTGSSDDQKRELAAFFANVMYETGLCYINQRIPSSNYCQSSSTWPCASGKSYHGRGPIQLSWNYNYGPAGQDIGFDGLNNPEKVGQDATISFKTAVWFWMKNSDCHSAITSGQGFGGTIRAINGVECNGGGGGQEKIRVNYYQTFCSQLGVDPGTNISC